MTAAGMRIGLIGPLPPPSGGMANQTRQLADLLAKEGVSVEVVQVNPPYRPRWMESVKGLRAIARLLPYLANLWQTAGRVDLFHVLANSGWSWHLFAAPAVWVAKVRGIPAVVHYHGGEAQAFFRRAFAWIGPTLQRADAVVVPSAFLQGVFARYGVSVRVIPNVVDLSRFAPGGRKIDGEPRIVITRNLEPIYDIATALRAFRLVKERFPAARLTVAGSGPELKNLQALAAELEVAGAVTFAGRLDIDQMAQLYNNADLMVNPSLADNLPVSILESLASGVPVVSTNVGGVPFLVEDGKTALLVPAGDPAAMAEAMVDLLTDRGKACRLTEAGRELARNYAWPVAREKWLDVYRALRMQ